MRGQESKNYGVWDIWSSTLEFRAVSEHFSVLDLAPDDRALKFKMVTAQQVRLSLIRPLIWCPEGPLCKDWNT